MDQYALSYDFPNGVRIQRGFMSKPLGHDPDLTVKFEFPFEGLPTVTVTPVREGGDQVPFIETIIEVAEDHFVCRSGNAGDNIGILWIAVGLTPIV